MQPGELIWAISAKYTPEFEDLEKYVTNIKNVYINF